MKSITTLLIICVLGYCSCNAQAKKTMQQDTPKQMNLLDEQVNVLGSVFRMDPNGEDPLKGATNYLELIDAMDATEAQKQDLREQYNLYDQSLYTKKKDSLSPRLHKKSMEEKDRDSVNHKTKIHENK